MKPIVWIIVAAAVIGGGYMWYSGQQAKDQVTPVPEAASTDETQPKTLGEKVEGMAEKATAAVESAAETATEAADTATETATEAANTATETATESTAGAAGSGLSDLLTVDGFDMGKVVEAVDASQLNAVQKTTFKAGLEKAKDNPELLKGILDQIKTALGL